MFRSFSKAYGLAGLRIGCLVGEEQSDRAPARAAGVPDDERPRGGSAASERWRATPTSPAATRARCGTLRAELIARLRAVALFERVHDSETNFVFVKLRVARGGGVRSARRSRRAWNVSVASTAPLGAPAGLRIGVSLQGDADRLIAGLTAIKHETATSNRGPRERQRNQHPRGGGRA